MLVQKNFNRRGQLFEASRYINPTIKPITGTFNKKIFFVKLPIFPLDISLTSNNSNIRYNLTPSMLELAGV